MKIELTEAQLEDLDLMLSTAMAFLILKGLKEEGTRAEELRTYLRNEK